MNIEILMTGILALSFESKQLLNFSLQHIINKEKESIQFDEQINQEAEQEIVANPRLASIGRINKAGRPFDPNSTRAIVEDYLRKHGPTFKKQLIEYVANERSLSIEKATGRVNGLSNIIKEGGVWRLPDMPMEMTG